MADKPPFREDFIKKVASALYAEHVDQAEAHIQKISVNLEQFVRAYEEAVEANDRSCAIICFALIDDIAIDIFRKYFPDQTKTFADRVVSENGILPTAYARILMTYALNWITKATFDDLNILRKIRNDFAHKTYIGSFAHEKIKGYLSSFKIDNSSLLDVALEHMFAERALEFNEAADIVKTEYIRREKFFFLFNSLTITSTFALEMLVAPTAHVHRVHPYAIINRWAEEDGSLKQVRMISAHATMKVINSVLPAKLQVTEE